MDWHGWVIVGLYVAGALNAYGGVSSYEYVDGDGNVTPMWRRRTGLSMIGLWFLIPLWILCRGHRFTR
jgi:hypothetical protein